MKQLHKSIFCILLSSLMLLSSTNLFSQDKVDVIYLKNGSKIFGKIIELKPNETVKLETKDGSIFVYKMDEIEKIEKDFPLIKTKYPELGVTLGLPGAIHAVVGYHFGMVGARVSAGTVGEISGIQLSVPIKLSETYETYHAIAFAGGYSTMDVEEENLWGDTRTVNKEWSYASLSYNLNTHGFFLEVGLSAGQGDFTNPQLMVQIGYVHRFNEK